MARFIALFSLWAPPTGPPLMGPPLWGPLREGGPRVASGERLWLQAPGFGSALLPAFGSASLRLSAGFWLGFRIDFGMIWFDIAAEVAGGSPRTTV